MNRGRVAIAADEFLQPRQKKAGEAVQNPDQ